MQIKTDMKKSRKSLGQRAYYYANSNKYTGKYEMRGSEISHHHHFEEVILQIDSMDVMKEQSPGEFIDERMHG